MNATMHRTLALGSEPAVPCVETSGPHRQQHTGLTKLEFFAAIAMQGILAGRVTEWTPSQTASAALECAEALLEELAK